MEELTLKNPKSLYMCLLYTFCCRMCSQIGWGWSPSEFGRVDAQRGCKPKGKDPST